MTPNTKIFTDLLRESRAFLTVSAAEYGAGHNAAEAFRILPDSMLGVLVRHCETVSWCGRPAVPLRRRAAFRPQHKRQQAVF